MLLLLSKYVTNLQVAYVPTQIQVSNYSNQIYANLLGL